MQGIGNLLGTPEAQARARIMELEAQDRLAQQADARRRTQEEADRVRQTGETTDRANQAYNNALTYGTNRTNALGINDDYGIMDLYRTDLDAARGRIPTISDNPGSYFTPETTYTGAYNTALKRERTNLGNQLDEFAGYGFDKQAFADTADDDIISRILGEQRGDALMSLDSSLARGKINQFGYDRGLQDLNNMFLSGQSRANDLGGGVLEGYRGQLRTVADNARNRAANFDFGQNFDVGGIQNELSGLRESLGGRMEGDILRAIGDTSFFDVSKLIGRAGERSGIITPTNTGVGSQSASGDNRTLNTKVF